MVVPRAAFAVGKIRKIHRVSRMHPAQLVPPRQGVQLQKYGQLVSQSIWVEMEPQHSQYTTLLVVARVATWLVSERAKLTGTDVATTLPYRTAPDPTAERGNRYKCDLTRR